MKFIKSELIVKDELEESAKADLLEEDQDIEELFHEAKSSGKFGKAERNQSS